MTPSSAAAPDALLQMLLALAAIVIILIFAVGSKGRALIPSRIQSLGEMAYGFVYKMVEDVAGHDGAKFFPLIMTLFLFILSLHLLYPLLSDVRRRLGGEGHLRE